MEPISNNRSFEAWCGKLPGPALAFDPKKMLYAPGFEEEKVKTAFPLAMEKGFEGFGDRIDVASGEKNKTTGLPSPVEKETVSPLTTGTEAALGTMIPPSLESEMSVFAMSAKL